MCTSQWTTIEKALGVWRVSILDSANNMRQDKKKQKKNHQTKIKIPTGTKNNFYPCTHLKREKVFYAREKPSLEKREEGTGGNGKKK